MKTPKPKHSITAGQLRLSMFPAKGSAKPLIMLERTHGDLETGWYPAASFPTSEFPCLVEAVQLMQGLLQGSKGKEPAGPASPPAAANDDAPGEGADEEPPFDPDPPRSEVTAPLPPAADPVQADPPAKSDLPVQKSTKNPSPRKPRPRIGRRPKRAGRAPERTRTR